MMKGKTLVVLALVSAMAFASIPMVAQAAQSVPAAGSPSRQTLTKRSRCCGGMFAAKKEITAANMNLTADEATKFWPIYDQYAAEVTKISDSRVALIKEYAATYSTMTDAQANDFMRELGYRPAVHVHSSEVRFDIREGDLGKEGCVVVPDRPSPRSYDQFAASVEHPCGGDHQVISGQVVEEERCTLRCTALAVSSRNTRERGRLDGWLGRSFANQAVSVIT